MISYRVADQHMAAYLVARDRRYALPSQALSITGEVSRCCGAPTFSRPTRKRSDVMHCSECRRVCEPKPWHVPRGQSRIGSTLRRIQCDAEDLRRAVRFDSFRDLQTLIETVPAHLGATEWEMQRLAWEAFLVLGTFQSASEVCTRRALRLDTIAPDETSARDWVRSARRVVIVRLERDPVHRAREAYLEVAGTR